MIPKLNKYNTLWLFLIAQKLNAILLEKNEIKSVVNTFLDKTLDLKTGATKPEALGDVFSGYSEKINVIFTVLNESIAEKKGWLTDIKTEVNKVYTGTLDDTFANYDTVLAEKLTALKAREEALDAAKTALITKANAAADATNIIGEIADADFKTKLENVIDELQSVATQREEWLSDSAAALDAYYTEDSKDKVVDEDYSKLSGAIEHIVDLLQAADSKDASVVEVLRQIAVNMNAVIDDGIEEIPEDLKGTGAGQFADTAEGLAAYKASLKLEVVTDETANPVTVYNTYAGKIAAVKAQVEVSELKVIDDIIAAVNDVKYGVTAAHKLTNNVPAVPGAIGAALDDILAKGVSNNNQALKDAVKDDKQANGTAVIATSDTNESVYVGKVHTALVGWQTTADSFKTTVNEKITEVNADVTFEDNKAAAIADNATPNNYGAAVVNALGKYQTEIERLNQASTGANNFKENIRTQVNGEKAADKLADSASYSDIQTGLSTLLSDYNKELNKILWGAETEGTLA